MSDTTDEDPIDSKDISNTNLDQEMRQSYLDYAMSVIAVTYTHLTLPTTPYV